MIRKRKQITAAAVFCCVLLTAAVFLLAPAVRICMLPRTSKEQQSDAPPAYYNIDAIVEEYEHPMLTRTNHFLKVKLISVEHSNLQSQNDTYRFTDTIINNDETFGFVAKIMTFEVLDNLSQSDIEAGDQIRLFGYADASCVSYYEGKEAVYLSIPVFRNGEDDASIIDGETYYYTCMPNELFFLLDGKIYPYRDITYEEEFPDFPEFIGWGNPYAQFRGMTEDEFRKAVRPLLKNPRN